MSDGLLQGIAIAFFLLIYLAIIIFVIRTVVHYAARIFAEEIADELERRKFFQQQRETKGRE